MPFVQSLQALAAQPALPGPAGVAGGARLCYVLLREVRGEKGYARDQTAPKPDPVKLARVRQEAADHERYATAERLRKALWLWSQRKPIAGSPAERYLREARVYGDAAPEWLVSYPDVMNIRPR